MRCGTKELSQDEMRDKEIPVVQIAIEFNFTAYSEGYHQIL